MCHDLCEKFKGTGEAREIRRYFWTGIQDDLALLNRGVSLNDQLTIAEAYISGARSQLTAAIPMDKVRSYGIQGGQAKKVELKKERYNLGSFPSP